MKSVLEIPPGSLKIANSYVISVQVFQIEGPALVNAKTTVYVKARGAEVSIVPQDLTVGIGKTAFLEAIIEDRDNLNEDFNVTWTCMKDESELPCPNMERDLRNKILVSFIEEGTYDIIASVLVGNELLNATASLRVYSKVIAGVRIREMPKGPVPSSESLQINATVIDLVPKCLCNWSVVQEDGFDYFDSSVIPNGLGGLYIQDIDENFLSELVDYGNDTLERDLDMYLPAGRDVEGWEGLKPNGKYKFRLTSVCPEPLNDDDNEEKKNNRGSVTSYTDVVIETNGPPEGMSLEVIPESGVGLKAYFKFSTKAAKDADIDYPLKYTFWYKIKDYMVNVGEYYETSYASDQVAYTGK